MSEYKLQVPEGLGDILTDECCVKRTAEAAIRNVFYGYGLKEVSTPTFEYLDVFNTGQAVLEQEDMFKLTDPKGRIMAIRPDVTIPIARMSATNMKDEPKPLKLFYIADVFRVSQTSGQREFTQAGAEIIGVPGVEADGECISMAVQAMKATGIEDFRIEIGQVGFFESIIDEIDIPASDKADLSHYIKHKNLVAVEEFLNRKKINGGLKDLLLSVPVLYGEVQEVLKLAREFPLNDDAVKALDDIEKAYTIISEYGYKDYVSVDLGMVKELPYYTGIIFKGFTRDFGFIICSGGRYDRLQREFGEDAPATGFAINVSRLVQALYKQSSKSPDQQQSKSYILKCSDAGRKKAIKTAQKLRCAGLYVELCITTADIEQIINYAKAKGAKKIITLQEGSRLRVTDVDTGKRIVTSIPGIIAGQTSDKNKCISGWH